MFGDKEVVSSHCFLSFTSLLFPKLRKLSFRSFRPGLRFTLLATREQGFTGDLAEPGSQPCASSWLMCFGVQNEQLCPSFPRAVTSVGARQLRVTCLVVQLPPPSKITTAPSAPQPNQPQVRTLRSEKSADRLNSRRSTSVLLEALSVGSCGSCIKTICRRNWYQFRW